MENNAKYRNNSGKKSKKHAVNGESRRPQLDCRETERTKLLFGVESQGQGKEMGEGEKRPRSTDQLCGPINPTRLGRGRTLAGLPVLTLRLSSGSKSEVERVGTSVGGCRQSYSNPLDPYRLTWI